MRFLQNHPLFLERVYRFTYALLGPFRRWLVPGGTVERFFIEGERLSKGAVFDCRMCGQCILHSTGMTCPMTCPKHMRNGPCGGVQADGRCEILRDRPCVWVQAWERTQHMPRYGAEIQAILPPLDGRLKGTSAWINDLQGTSREAPAGWQRA
jgi:hypothetical protein